jgi:hypothetical protein
MIDDMLFETEATWQLGTPRCWDISLDSQRFLMVKIEEWKSRPVTEMILVQNWFEELKQRVPVSGNGRGKDDSHAKGRLEEPVCNSRMD